jgi:uncharacterized protein (TIGR00255 family)
MIRSMTGFGLGRSAIGTEELTVELRSVNHKFCEVKVRLPRELSVLEGSVSKTIKDKLSRGAIDAALKRTSRSAAGTVPVIDVGLVREYRRAFSEIAAAAGLPDEVSLRDLSIQSGVMRLEEQQVNLEDAGKALEQALGQAIHALTAMREVEGRSLATDLRNRLAFVATTVGEIQKLAPISVEEHRKRLQERISELTQGLAIDPARMAQEIAFFAERTDIAEELTRLASHLEQFDTLLSAKEPTGRKMDFLVQEMHREVNTTGSKSQHPEISTRIVALKAELERVREQVQNVE